MSDLRYPICLDNQGDLALALKPEVEAVISVLQTMRGERVYRPEYGTPSPLFEATHRGTLTDLDVEGVNETIQVLYQGLIVDVPYTVD